MKKVIEFLGMAILGGAISLGAHKLLIEEKQPLVVSKITSPVQMVNSTYNATSRLAAATIDFTVAAENTVNAVVHVKNTAIRTQNNPFAELFFGSRNGTRKFEQVGTGSGVIISADGYIVTNNHVIDGASSIEVTLNNQKQFKAELIGTDPANDIALLKVDTTIDLPYIPFADSDAIKVGEWVLAVGNPYNLTSTVTAGIVSAKGRDLEGNRNIESFIQTDAAVNPGNSGGALVNNRGELVGINTAISSKTGSFVGYSFAVPSNIAKKIIDDILEFGKVQEAILGVNVDITYNGQGVKVAELSDVASGAKKAGIQEGDIITKINNIKITKFSDLKGQLTAKRPGDFVSVTLDRDGKTLVKKVKLSKSVEHYISDAFQWELKDLSKEELRKRGIASGVKIIRTGRDDDTSMSFKNYIITKINGVEVNNAKETAKKLDQLAANQVRVIVETLNVNGEVERFIYR